MQVVIDSASESVHGDSSSAVNMHNVTICAGIYKDSRFRSRGRGVHSIMDMICNSSRSGIQLRGCYVNTSAFPCRVCAEALINLQISKLIVLNIPNFFLRGSGDDVGGGVDVGGDGEDEGDLYEIYNALDGNGIDVEFYNHPRLTVNMLSTELLAPISGLTALSNSRVILFNELFDETVMNAMYNKFNSAYYKKRSHETSCCVFSTAAGRNAASNGGQTTVINGVEHTLYNYTRDMMELKEKFEAITNRSYDMALLIFVDRLQETYGFIPNSCVLFMTETRQMEFHFEKNQVEPQVQREENVINEVLWDVNTRDVNTRDVNTRDVNTRDVNTRDVNTRDVTRTVRALIRPGSAVVCQTRDVNLYKPITFNSVKQTRKTLVITFV